MSNMSWIERLLRKYIPHKELGWTEIGETFTRFQLVKTPWFNVYLHRLDAPSPHPKCHDHPWSFMAVILKGGYTEYLSDGAYRRIPGDVLFRHATARHNVVTNGVNWSVVVTNRKTRDWRLIEEHDDHCTAPDKDAL